VFTYPGSGFLTDKILGTPIPLQGTVKGLSLVGEGLPGVGPAVTLPASYLLPDKPSTDWIKGLLFPYGDRSTGNPITDLTQNLTPAWADKIVTGLAGNPDTDRLYANTVFDVAKELASTGKYDLHGDNATAEYNRLLSDAKTKAKWLYVIRGVAQAFSPSAPTPKFQAKDKSGNWIAIDKMAKEYQDQLKKTNDPGLAFQDLIDRYGVDNFLVPQAKSKPLIPGLTSTQDQLDFERAHPDIVKSYQNTWALFAPTGGSFDQTAYEQQFGRGERQQLTPDQMIRFANARLAQQQYNKARTDIGPNPGNGDMKYLHDLHDELVQKYPGFGDSQPTFKQNKVIVGELIGASTDPNVTGTDAGQGLREYLAARQQAQQQGLDAGLKTSDSVFQAKETRGSRNWLRDTAKEIIARHPAFRNMWDQVFSRELKRDL